MFFVAIYQVKSDEFASVFYHSVKSELLLLARNLNALVLKLIFSVTFFGKTY